jgi:hypothetical protein
VPHGEGGSGARAGRGSLRVVVPLTLRSVDAPQRIDCLPPHRLGTKEAAEQRGYAPTPRRCRGGGHPELCADAQTRATFGVHAFGEGDEARLRFGTHLRGTAYHVIDAEQRRKPLSLRAREPRDLPMPQPRAGPTRSPAVGDTPGARQFIALLEAFRATGGTVAAEIVGRMLEERRAGNAPGLAHLVSSNQVFGFEWRDRLWIPMFQFDADDLTLRPGPLQVRAELPALWLGWTLASWFASPNAWLNGCPPVDLLDSNVAAVAAAARSWGRAAAFVQPNLRRVRKVVAPAAGR